MELFEVSLNESSGEGRYKALLPLLLQVMIKSLVRREASRSALTHERDEFRIRGLRVHSVHRIQTGAGRAAAGRSDEPIPNSPLISCWGRRNDYLM